MLKEVIVAKAPHLPRSLSFEVLPEIKEYERTSTTVINAYVMPIVATYLRALRKGLDAGGIPARLLLMQSNGGLTTDGAAAERPMNIIESNWAGGRRGRRPGAGARKRPRQDHHLRHGRHHRQGLDGRARRGRARPGICRGRGHHDRLAAADGRRLYVKVPAIDLAEVGAGGGSHVWIDGGGALQAGPRAPAPRPARSVTTRAAPNPPSPTPTCCSATSTRRISSAAR